MCRPLVFDPLEWLYTISLARALLPGLSFHMDGQAAEAAARAGGMDVRELWRLDWRRPAVYMPPFRALVSGTVVVAVEGYTAVRLVEAGVEPDVVVGDMDFRPEGMGLGRYAVVHFHGDNFRRIRPPPGIYSVQAWPRGCTFNVPGFTDGDRAVYLAYYMGAESIAVSGFRPEEPVKRDDEVKRRKLALAAHLLRRLARRVRLQLV